MKKKKVKQSKIKNLRTRILSGFGVIVLLLMLSSLFNILCLNDINRSMKTIMEKEMKLLISDEKLLTDMNKRTSLMRGYLAYDDEAYLIQFNTETKKSIELENQALALSNSAELKTLIDKKIAWGRLTDQALEAYNNGDAEEAKTIMNTQAQAVENELEKGFSDLAAKREVRIQEFSDDIMRKGKIIQKLGIVVTILVAVLSVISAYITSRSITKPINLVMRHMQTIAGGDLSVEPLNVVTEDETGQLAAAMNMMQDVLKGTMHKISDDSETLSAHSEELNQAAFEVKSGSEQVATTMQELATGTETQANTASSLSIVMGNFTKKVRDTNKSGEQISKTSQRVLEMTTEGSRLMKSSNQQMQKIDSIVQDAVEKMAILDNQTKEISDLVSIIQTVADQTNLLALNAAIEAARAG
ncbi:methyl-accepting chemotaxis protein, partial [Carnobacterium sp.]|uniref:methyl-accepting chemotaxis protein n=1 Tax=Carnobacterium sp. TaxID=48221 RepID=UPI0028AF9C81